MVRRISLLLLTAAALLSVATMNSLAQTVLTHHMSAMPAEPDRERPQGVLLPIRPCNSILSCRCAIRQD
jgi:hypothetical protein